MAGLNSKHQKSSGFGKTGSLKKDGYASNSVPESAQGWKPGTPYSGPPVAKGTHSGGGN
jgi:hypothetical protein